MQLGGPDVVYRYRGRIGIGSTADEVYAELGKPVRSAPEGLAGVGPDRVLFTTSYGGRILYRSVALEFVFEAGEVVSLSKVWE